MRLALLVCASMAWTTCASAQSVAPANAVTGATARQVFELRTTVARTVELLMPPGVRVQSVQVGSPNSFVAMVSNNGMGVMLQAIHQGARSTMTLITSAGRYNLRLIGVPEATPGIVSLADMLASAGRPALAAAASPMPPAITYKLSGKRELRPSSIRDDGDKTYIEWSTDQALPAVFALDRLGREEMVDGYMRDEVFTIDRVHERLVFRIDKQSASAQRKRSKAR